MVTIAAPSGRVRKGTPGKASRVTQLVGGQARILAVDCLTLEPVSVCDIISLIYQAFVPSHLYRFCRILDFPLSAPGMGSFAE